MCVCKHFGPTSSLHVRLSIRGPLTVSLTYERPRKSSARGQVPKVRNLKIREEKKSLRNLKVTKSIPKKVWKMVLLFGLFGRFSQTFFWAFGNTIGGPGSTVQIGCRWKLLPEVFLGILYAKKYAWHIPLLWTTRIFWVIFCCFLGRTNWERIT